MLLGGWHHINPTIRKATLDKRGVKINRLTLVDFIKETRVPLKVVLVCKCGNTIIKPYKEFIKGRIKSCGCILRERKEQGTITKTKNELLKQAKVEKKKLKKHTPHKDFTGKQNGYLTVLWWCGIRFTPKGTEQMIWYCRCSCGKEVIRTGESVNRTNNSCGCINHEARRATALKTIATRKEKELKLLPNKSIEYSYKPKKRGRLRKTIREAVFLKHGNHCIICGLKDNKANNIDIHHLKAHSEHPKLRMMVVNMIPLCKTCHTRLHKALGWVNVPVMAQIQFINKLVGVYGSNHHYGRVA